MLEQQMHHSTLLRGRCTAEQKKSEFIIRPKCVAAYSWAFVAQRGKKNNFYLFIVMRFVN